MKTNLLTGMVLSLALVTQVVFAENSTITSSLIQIDDTQYEVKQSDEKKLTVVFESGFGTDANVWNGIAESLSDQFQTISYSRIGTGKTVSSKTALSIDEHVAELKKLTEHLDVDHPFILVGHSYGGLVATRFARQFPKDLHALVLVEPSVLSQRVIFKKMDKERIQQDDQMLEKYMPPHFIESYKTLKAEMDTAPYKVSPLPSNIPTLLMTSTQVSEKPFVFEETAKGKDAWLAIHKSLIAPVSHQEHILFNDAGHNIHLEQPEKMVHAIVNFVGN
ncbi:alpha/beta fold hydrolase [Alteromonas gracilis]|uniref:alpha/beta fold hydrolase n=1 Tax=Alteromonas gracilis TaxID=1479524 RepID=UPI0037351639